MAGRQFSLSELSIAAQLEAAGRRDRVATVEKLVAAKKRSDHDLLKLAGSFWQLRAMARAFEVLDRNRNRIPADVLEQIEAPL